MNDKQYLIICSLDVIIKNIGARHLTAEFDFGYKPFNETDAVINHINLAVIAPEEDKNLVRGWFDEVFCQPPCLIVSPMDNVISKIIDDWGRSRARNHVLLLGNDLTDYATEDMPCITFDQDPLFFKQHCFCIDGGWKMLALMLRNRSVIEAINSGRDVIEIIWDAVGNAALRQETGP